MTSRAEVTTKYAKAYAKASKKDKGRVLDAVTDVTGWSRDNARRRLVAAANRPPGARAFEVKRLCELVEVERSSYYAWVQAAPAREARAAADAELVERIRAVHTEDKTCGAPRITAGLNDGAEAGERVNHKRVARVMREHGIRGYQKKRRVRTTIPEPSGQWVPDLLKRDFTAEAANQRYVGDITYLPIADGSNLYLATVIDCYSRRLAGWAVADHMRTSLVEDALKAAAATRGSLKGAIFHSDHGSVYCSKDYAKLCGQLGVTQSMGAE